MATIASYDVRLFGIETSSFFLSNKPEGFVGKAFNFELSAEMRVQADKKLIHSNIMVNIRESKDSEILGHLTMIYFFELSEFEKVIKPNNDKKEFYTIPEDLQFQLRIISLSTTRGVLYSNLKGTYLAGATLPIISSPSSQDTEGE